MKLREYVSSSDLAAEIDDWVRTNDQNYHRLAERAEVSPRAVSKVINGDRPYQSVFLADRLMRAMGRYIYHLPTEWRKSGS
jgi:hypothetical protein